MMELQVILENYLVGLSEDEQMRIENEIQIRWKRSERNMPENSRLQGLLRCL